MDVVIASLTLPDPGPALRPAAAAHPLLGRWLEAGSHCEVAGVAGVAEILAAARAAAAAGLPVAVLAAATPAELERAAAAGGLCLIVAGHPESCPPLAVFSGRSLPVLGPIPVCRLADLRHTWSALAGGAPEPGRHLLHEQPEEWDPQLERELTRRLRQLYGE